MRKPPGVFDWPKAGPLDTAALREARASAGRTQVRLGQSHSFVSKGEVGERRLDVIQLRTICAAMGTTPAAFVAVLERRLARGDGG